MSDSVWMTILYLTVQSLVTQVIADQYIHRLESNVNNSHFATVREGDNITSYCAVHYLSNTMAPTFTPFWYIQTEELQQINKVDSNHIYGNGNKIPPYSFKHQSVAGTTKNSSVTLLKVSYHFKTIALRCGVHVQPPNGYHYDLMDNNVIVIKIKQQELPTEAPTSTTVTMATTDTTETNTAKNAPCSSPISSSPVGSLEQPGKTDTLQGEDDGVSTTVLIGIICAAGVVLVVMATVIIGLTVCKTKQRHFPDVERGNTDDERQGRKPVSAENPCIVNKALPESDDPQTLVSLTSSGSSLCGDRNSSECSSRRLSEENDTDVFENSSATEDSNNQQTPTTNP